MKNSYNIKYFYILDFYHFTESLARFPEEEVRLKVLTEYLTQAMQHSQLKHLISIYLNQLLYGETFKGGFLQVNFENRAQYKLNLVQLQYSAQKVNTSTELMTEVLEFVSTCENKDVEQFLIKFYKRINITYLNRDTLIQLYNKFGMQKLIPKPKLTDFVNEVVKVVEKRIRKPKYPVVIFEEEECNLVYFHKLDGEVVTNFENKSFIKNIFKHYARLSIIGNFSNNTWTCYIATTKKKVVEKFIHKDKFTLQNSLRYLLGDFGRINNSLSAFKDFKNSFEVKKGLGSIYFDEEMFVEELLKRPKGFAFFRNDILDLSDLVISRYIAQGFNYVEGKVMLQNILSKNVIEFELEKFDGEDVKVGAQVFVIKVGQYEYVKIKEGKC